MVVCIVLVLVVVQHVRGRRREVGSLVALEPDVHVLIPTIHLETFTNIETLIHRANWTFGRVFLHFGLDYEDAATLQKLQTHVFPQRVRPHIHRVSNRRSDISIVANEMFIALRHVRAYFFRFNDDTVMMTDNWNAIAVGVLSQPPHVNVGLAHVQDKNNLRIQTHSFFSSVHYDIFGYLFPFDFHNWYEDDWITNVYTFFGLCKASSVVVRHLGHKERYAIAAVDQAVLNWTVVTGQSKVQQYLYNGGALSCTTYETTNAT